MAANQTPTPPEAAPEAAPETAPEAAPEATPSVEPEPKSLAVASQLVEAFVGEPPVETAPVAEPEPEPEAPAPEPARTPPHPLPPTKTSPDADGELDLRAPELYLNRELTWLNFNWRVLHEAEDERTQLLERVKFVAIVSSNLDEFYMKRIGGLKQQIGAGLHELSVDGRTPRQQITECLAAAQQLSAHKQDLFERLSDQLSDNGIVLAGYEQLEDEEKESLREYYFENIFPLVTPQAMDPAHPFPFISNLSLNLLVTLNYPKDDTPSLARVKVPVGAGIPRFLEVSEGSCIYVALEDIMANNLDLLFPGMKVVACEKFRVTRNANTEQDEEQADDLLAMIESELRERKFAPIVRLEVGADTSVEHRGMLASEFGLDESTDVVEVHGMLAMYDLIEIATLDIPELRDPPHFPVNPAELADERLMFHVIRDKGSLLVHHPYESFTGSVERFLREASVDPKVRAIKMTLYRTSEETRVIQYLIDAARNGKQVAVALELKARFDEEANIRWANRLERVGIHVTYGVVGLKTHCKIILVVRQDYDGLRRYAQVGTGNYHAGTARLYSDLGLFTCDDQIGRDLTELFNYLTTGYKPKRNYNKILPAPKVLKQALLSKIDREIELHSPDAPGAIQMKMNALEDRDITRALYRASRAGVTVQLIVRDTCRLRPGIAGLSDNVTVISVVGRFLEHTRLVYFRAGGNEEYYIGSADCMKRNLESRVEAMVPVEDPRLQRELRALLDAQLNDRRRSAHARRGREKEPHQELPTAADRSRRETLQGSDPPAPAQAARSRATPTKPLISGTTGASRPPNGHRSPRRRHPDAVRWDAERKLGHDRELGMLSWKTRPRKDGEMYIVLEGELTEGESLHDLEIDADRVVFNMARVRYINSEGSRRLLHFLEDVGKRARITAELCAPAVVDLINMVPIFLDHMRVESVIVPIECPNCFAEGDLRVHLPAHGTPDLDYPDCEDCGTPTELAALEERYFAFLNSQN
jgi:polyphosphate kinase